MDSLNTSDIIDHLIAILEVLDQQKNPGATLQTPHLRLVIRERLKSCRPVRPIVALEVIP